MNVRRLTCLVNIFLCRIWPRVQKIVHDGRIKQNCILGNDTDVAAKTLELEISEIVAVNGNGAIRDVVEAEEKLERGGLSTT